jgi:excisionase family DNA binding protein
MESPASNDALMTAEEVAEHLRVSEGTINQWVKAGRIPVVKVGKLNRFRRSDIEAWVESNSKPAENGGAA